MYICKSKLRYKFHVNIVSYCNTIHKCTYTQILSWHEPCPEQSHGHPSPRYMLSKAQTLPLKATLSCIHRNRVAGDL